VPKTSVVFSRHQGVFDDMNTFSLLLMPRMARAILAALLTGVLLLACGMPAAAQKDKKKKDPPPGSIDLRPMVPMGDQQQIDYLISEMLGAWQVGDLEKLHKDYADDVSVVSGAWTPPIFGWQSYLAVYQAQRARTRQVRLDRSNTYIKLSGNFAWAAYQWDFTGAVDGQPTQAQGQTTLILEKRNNRWVIVHNHTSIVQAGLTPMGPAATPASTPPPQQPEASKPPAN
jgi:ketosteroid isomerase-like protein